MDSRLFGLKEWSFIVAPIAAIWIVLAVWLRCGRSKRWIKASMVAAIAVITVSWIPFSVQSIRDARRLENARIAQEHAANEMLRALKHANPPAHDQGR